MSSSYPPIPGYRMAYDIDGTQVFVAYNNPPSYNYTAFAVAGADINKMNNEDVANDAYSTICSQPHDIVAIFPEKRNLTGFFIGGKVTGSASTPFTYTTWLSLDATNGTNGTWTAGYTTPFAGPAVVVPGYRTLYRAANLPNIRGVKFTSVGVPNPWNVDWAAMHLYGTIVTGENVDRLDIWHPTLNSKAPASWFDYGDVARSSSADIQFRVKNLSPTRTANAPIVSTSGLTVLTPPVAGQHLLSKDAVTYAATQTLPNLLPGAISGIVTIRRDTDAAAVITLNAFRLIADATTWT